MNNSNSMLRAVGALAAGLLLSGAAPAEDLGKPRLLVASPAMQGFYRHTALVVVPKRGQFVGFILNRATDIKIASAFPDHAPSAKVAEPINFGGPEEAHQVYAVVRRNPGNPSKNIFGDLYVTQGSQAVDRIIEETPNDARYFAGYVAWEAGELEKEIAAGLWYVTDADAAVVMRKDTNALWEDLVKRFGNGHAPQKGLQETRLEAIGTPRRS
jgi:putative transcriptional regulator